MSSPLVQVHSLPEQHFLDPLDHNALSPIQSLSIPTPSTRRWMIRGVSLIALQEILPEFHFFSSARGLTNSPMTDRWIASFGFGDTDAHQFGNEGPFRWYKEGLSTPYYDLDVLDQVGTPSLHVLMINRAPLGKLAGPEGAMRVNFWLEPFTAGAF